MNIEKTNISSQSQKMCLTCHTFYASEAFNGLCSVCYKKNTQAKKEEPKIQPTIIPSDTSLSPMVEEKNQQQIIEEPVQKDRKRCFDCNKKVGLLGIQCKCGFVFCNGHRLPEDHKCSYDYQSAGKKKLEKEIVKVYNGKIAQI